MNLQIAEQWAAELESGKYEQANGYLCKDGAYCCLGILCEMALRAGADVARAEGPEYGTVVYNGYISLTPVEVMRWAGMRTEKGVFRIHNGYGTTLAEQNDRGATFPEIAAIIRQHAADL